MALVVAVGQLLALGLLARRAVHLAFTCVCLGCTIEVWSVTGTQVL